MRCWWWWTSNMSKLQGERPCRCYNGLCEGLGPWLDSPWLGFYWPELFSRLLQGFRHTTSPPKRSRFGQNFDSIFQPSHDWHRQVRHIKITTTHRNDKLQLLLHQLVLVKNILLRDTSTNKRHVIKKSTFLWLQSTVSKTNFIQIQTNMPGA